MDYRKNGEIVIIEDDMNYALMLQKELLKYYNDEAVILNTYDEEYINTHKIDLIISDVDLGTDVDEYGQEYRVNAIKEIIKMRKAQRGGVEVIIVSNNDGYIQRSFEAQATYFITKLDLKKELPIAIGVLRDKGFREKSMHEIKGNIFNMHDIRFIEGANHNIKIHTCDDNIIPIRAKLDDIEDDLEQFLCIRTHKSYIVNLRYIKTHHPGYLDLWCGSVIPIGRIYKEMFKNKYKTAKLEGKI